MAYDKTDLHLLPVAPGSTRYEYDAGSDTMATVLGTSGTGYFDNGPDDAPKLVAGDMIFCKCTDGNMLLKVASVTASTGAVVCQWAGGDLPVQTWATGTAAGDFGMKPGYYEVGTSIATGTRGVLPTPYAGLEVKVFKVDSGTQTFSFDAGACASNISWVDGTVGGGTGVTYDGTNRRIILRAEGDSFHVKATSTSRYRLHNLEFAASAVSEAGSVVMPGT